MAEGLKIRTGPLMAKADATAAGMSYSFVKFAMSRYDHVENGQNCNVGTLFLENCSRDFVERLLGQLG